MREEDFPDLCKAGRHRVGIPVMKLNFRHSASSKMRLISL